MSEARADRLDRLEEDVREIKAALVRLEPLINRIDAQLPQFATKLEVANLRTEVLTALAEKPSRSYLWGVMAAMVGAQAVALAAAALIFSIVQTRPATSPPHAGAAPASIVLADDRFDWDRYHARQDACADKDRIVAQCARGGDYCDELALRQVQRACSAFGPLGERR